MIWIRSLLFNLLFVCWTILLGLGASPSLVHPKTALAISALWMDVVFWLLRVCCGVTVRVEGESPSTPVIFAAKHQSAWETLYLWRTLDNPAFILKRELIQIPIFGWYLARSYPIAIDRSAGRRAMEQVIKQGQARLDAGRSIVIFPEGTRTKPGTTKPYKKGVFALQEATKATVVPVAHNAGLCWPRNSFCKYPGVITLRFLQPIAHAEFTASQLQEVIEKESQSLL